MKAPDESGINKDFTEKSTDWIATDDKRCTDVRENAEEQYDSKEVKIDSSELHDIVKY